MGLFTRRPGRVSGHQKHSTQLQVQALEDRTVLSPGSFAMHIHPFVTITINGVKQTIPTNIGISPDGNTFHEIHTHDTTGKLHIETNEPRDFRLDEFFATWGKPFSSTRILGFQAPSGKTVTMTVNGTPNTLYGAYVVKDGDQIDIQLDNAVPADPLQLGPFFAIGGEPGRVHVHRKADGLHLLNFSPYGHNFTGLINVAVGDFNGDGYQDIVTGINSGSAHVKVFNGKALAEGTFDSMNPDANLISSFYAFDPKFGVGVNLAVGKVTGKPLPELVVSANVGNPHVKVISGQTIASGLFGTPGNSKLLTNFFAYGLNFNVGSSIAVGDLTKSGFADIITGATAGNPHVKVYRGQAIANGTFNTFKPDDSLRTNFFAYGLSFNVGVNVAAADTVGAGFASLITGSSVGSSHVKVYSGQALANGTFKQNSPDASLLTNFFAYESSLGSGVRISASDFNGDNKADILTGTTINKPNYRVVKGNATGTKPTAILEGIGLDLKGGVTVGA
jgi:hypothetical protein